MSRKRQKTKFVGVVILSFASKSDDANSPITEPALQALGAANLQD